MHRCGTVFYYFFCTGHKYGTGLYGPKLSGLGKLFGPRRGKLFGPDLDLCTPKNFSPSKKYIKSHVTLISIHKNFVNLIRFINNSILSYCSYVTLSHHHIIRVASITNFCRIPNIRSADYYYISKLQN